MSEPKMFSMQGSFVAGVDNKIPKFILRIELLKTNESETEVQVQSKVKSQYLIYDESDNVLYKTSQLLREITAQVSDRNEKACDLET